MIRVRHQAHLEQSDLDQPVQRGKSRCRVGGVRSIHAIQAGDHRRGAHFGSRHQRLGDLCQFGCGRQTLVQLRVAPGDQADPLQHQPVDGGQGAAQTFLDAQSIGQRIARHPVLPPQAAM